MPLQQVQLHHGRRDFRFEIGQVPRISLGGLPLHQGLDGAVDLPGDLLDRRVWRRPRPFPRHLIHVTLGQLSPLWIAVQTCV